MKSIVARMIAVNVVLFRNRNLEKRRQLIVMFTEKQFYWCTYISDHYFVLILLFYKSFEHAVK
jgi:hypothetical protein